jgi:predicted XRE-type DNA-binding protein
MPATHRARTVSDSIIPKQRLASEVARILDDEGMTQLEAAYRIKDAPSQVSLMVTGKTRGFSSDRLIRTLTRLGRDVEITIRKKRGSGAGRVKIAINR